MFVHCLNHQQAQGREHGYSDVSVERRFGRLTPAVEKIRFVYLGVVDEPDL